MNNKEIITNTNCGKEKNKIDSKKILITTLASSSAILIIMGIIISKTYLKSNINAISESKESKINKEIDADSIIINEDNNHALKYSKDNGKTWIDGNDISLDDKNNVTWWSYDEYKKFIEEEKEKLNIMVKNQMTGYTPSRGDFVYTQEIADETIKQYNKELEAIKNGEKISKSVPWDTEDDCQLSSYSLDSAKNKKEYAYELELTNGKTITFTGKSKADAMNKAKEYCIKHNLQY